MSTLAQSINYPTNDVTDLWQLVAPLGQNELDPYFLLYFSENHLVQKVKAEQTIDQLDLL